MMDIDSLRIEQKRIQMQQEERQKKALQQLQAECETLKNEEAKLEQYKNSNEYAALLNRVKEVRDTRKKVKKILDACRRKVKLSFTFSTGPLKMGRYNAAAAAMNRGSSLDENWKDGCIFDANGNLIKVVGKPDNRTEYEKQLTDLQITAERYRDHLSKIKAEIAEPNALINIEQTLIDKYNELIKLYNERISLSGPFKMRQRKESEESIIRYERELYSTIDSIHDRLPFWYSEEISLRSCYMWK